MWLVRLLIRLARPIARGRKRFIVGPWFTKTCEYDQFVHDPVDSCAQHLQLRNSAASQQLGKPISACDAELRSLRQLALPRIKSTTSLSFTRSNANMI